MVRTIARVVDKGSKRAEHTRPAAATEGDPRGHLNVRAVNWPRPQFNSAASRRRATTAGCSPSQGKPSSAHTAAHKTLLSLASAPGPGCPNPPPTPTPGSAPSSCPCPCTMRAREVLVRPRRASAWAPMARAVVTSTARGRWAKEGTPPSMIHKMGLLQIALGWGSPALGLAKPRYSSPGL
jgi:hypothetical protein